MGEGALGRLTAPAEERADARHGVIVVGAGAAGLWAAARAAELGASVLLLEKTERTGTKVLASGGTRCNLTTTLDADEAAALFGTKGARFLRHAFRILPPRAVRERFAELGVPTVEAPLEKVFPASDRARDVRDALERWARGAGVRIECGAAVAALEPLANGWRVVTVDGRRFEGDALLLAPGGKSYPRTGTTGDGYAWLTRLELPLVAPVPALVPLTSPAPWVHELTGLARQEVDVRLTIDGVVVGRRRRPIVFTHHGVSGPGAMDLSAPVARAVHEAPAAAFELRLDLAPDVSRDELRAALIAAAGRRGRAPALTSFVGELVPEGLPRRLAAAVVRAAGADVELRLDALSKPGRHALVESLKGLTVPIDGTLGFERAEVTSGGLALDAVDPGSMRVRGVPGLHVFGEVLDLAGPIGGLNFQSAFATAEVAARAATR